MWHRIRVDGFGGELPVEPSPLFDIRELRPEEVLSALGMLDGGPAPEDFRRRLSVGAFDVAEGVLRGVAVSESLATNGCIIHLHCADPQMGRALLDRALQKAAAAGRRSSQVNLHRASSAETVWSSSSWPVRERPAQAEASVEAEVDTEDVQLPVASAQAAPQAPTESMAEEPATVAA